jgi:hypothetical protein
LAEAVAVGEDGDRLWDGAGDLEIGGLAEGSGVFGEVLEKGAEFDGFRLENDLLGIGSGEEGEAGDDAVEAEGFVLPRQELFPFFLRELGVEKGALESGVQDCQWGFKFVGSVEGESTDAFERFGEAGGEVIEDPCEAVHFVAAAGDGEGGVEVLRGEFFRCADEILDRAEGSADEDFDASTGSSLLGRM